VRGVDDRKGKKIKKNNFTACADPGDGKQRPRSVGARTRAETSVFF
jgi:hypothetical protein